MSRNTFFFSLRTAVVKLNRQEIPQWCKCGPLLAHWPELILAMRTGGTMGNNVSLFAWKQLGWNRLGQKRAKSSFEIMGQAGVPSHKMVQPLAGTFMACLTR